MQDMTLCDSHQCDTFMMNRRIWELEEASEATFYDKQWQDQIVGALEQTGKKI